jgi:formylglycine-generating enzyme required for sulfatase activity
MPLNSGQVLQERYRIDALLGQGGMGAVYRATYLTFDTPVAIKENLEVTPEARRQFSREAGLLHQLRHPNLPRVNDYFFLPGQGQYLVMDFVDGQDLNRILAQRGPIPEAQALAWMGKVLEALVYLHSQNVIHRDVKPANVKITLEARVFLVDFGLAKLYDPQQKTTIGARGVTPGYAPPEQYGHGRTDSRTDVYSVGATLYALLTGQQPPDALEFMMHQAELVPPRQLKPGISKEVEAAILRAMQPLPQDRFQTAEAFHTALLKPPPTQFVPAREAQKTAGAPTRVPESLTGVGQPTPITPPPARQPLVKQEDRIPATPSPAYQQRPQARPTPVARHQGSPAAARQDPLASIARTARDLPVWIWAGAVVVLALIIWWLLASGSLSPPTRARAGDTWTRRGDDMVMVYVPAGEFLMGSSDDDSDAWGDEKPQRAVYLDAFWIDKTEVTNAQYGKCVEAAACPEPKCWRDDDRRTPDQPVVCVSWHDAETYAAWVGGRLPTEAEWEKAARGTDGRIYPWGNSEPDCEIANYWQCVGYPVAVGSHPGGASPYGVLDMAGNVWEWVADRYDGTYYARSPSFNPQGPEAGEYRALRGGAFNNSQRLVRCAFREDGDPNNWYENSGLRVVVDPDTSSGW